MKKRFLAHLAMVSALAVCSSARAGIIEDFQFNDANGTQLGGAVNSANPGNNWLIHANNNDQSFVVDGSYRIGKHSVTGQAANALEIANITSGKAYLVVEIAGWSYTSMASAPSERVRFAFMDNDPASTGGSIVTAEMNIDRLGDALTLRGEALGAGGTALLGTQYALPLVQTSPLTLVLELDKDLNQFTVFYKDGSNPFGTLGTGNLGERSAGVIREGRSLRFAFTGTFGDTGEFFDVDRIYLADFNPIPEPGTTLLATVAIAFLVAFRRHWK